MSFLSRLRDAIGGGPRRIAGFAPPPGPFDEPPAEPVELDPADLPWELRDEKPASENGNSGAVEL